MVHLSKPAQCREASITDKTGGCNSNAECSGKNFCLQARDNIKGNLSRRKVTGGADFTTKPIQLVGMRKGSMLVREVALKGLYAVLVVDGGTRKPRPDVNRKRRLSSPRDKRYVVCCILYSKRV